ncbi:MAG: Dephospho-CoA kinase [Pseudidiomarina mangrovi]|nr:MAG: Dephospho-CoA kinase [Pseudidiomarina mangrovi]
MIENGLQQFCQRVLVVDVDEATQCHRTASRDNVSSQQVKAVMAAQVSREKRLEHADDIIDNRGDVGNLQPQVQQLHQLYLRLASQ